MPDETQAAPRLFTPEILANPYPLYHSLRVSHPVHWEPGMQGWLVTRYDDVAAGLRSPKLSVTARNTIMRRQVSDPATLARIGEGSQNMLFSDPPAHTRMRGLVNKAFTPRAVDAMAERIQHLVDQLLDAAQARGFVEVIGDLAAPLPIAVIGAMLGFPEKDFGRLKGWSDALAIFGNTAGELKPDLLLQGLTARGELVQYMRGLFAERRAKPEQDLLTALIHAQEEGDRLSEGEVYSNAIVLMFAGHETTTNLIGLGMLNLLRNPDQLSLLRANPALLPDAVEELLRYDSPVQLTLRIALEDLTLGETPIRKGDLVWLIMGAANRDPAHFADPDRLDISRGKVNHLSFGAGIHFCLGAPLARLEGRIALGTLIRRFPHLRLPEQELHYHDHFTLHGIKALRVEF